MVGAWLSGRLAGRIKPKHQIRHGFVIMLGTSLVNVALNLLSTPHPCWAMLTVSIFSFGWALMVPVVTLLVLDLVPERRGMASLGAGLHRQHGQRPGGRRDRAAGDAFGGGAGADLAAACWASAWSPGSGSSRA